MAKRDFQTSIFHNQISSSLLQDKNKSFLWNRLLLESGKYDPSKLNEIRCSFKEVRGPLQWENQGLHPRNPHRDLHQELHLEWSLIWEWAQTQSKTNPKMVQSSMQMTVRSLLSITSQIKINPYKSTKILKTSQKVVTLDYRACECFKIVFRTILIKTGRTEWKLSGSKKRTSKTISSALTLLQFRSLRLQHWKLTKLLEGFKC